MDTAILQSVIDAGRRFAASDAPLAERLRGAAEAMVGREFDQSDLSGPLYNEAQAVKAELFDPANYASSEGCRRLATRLYDLTIEFSSAIAWHNARESQGRQSNPSDN